MDPVGALHHFLDATGELPDQGMPREGGSV